MNLSDRQQAIVEYLLSQHGLSAPSSAQISAAIAIHVDRTTLFRDLSALCDLEVISPKGETKARTYELNKESDAFLSWDLTRPPELRPRVSYNNKILEEYIPNETSWLGDSSDLMAMTSSHECQSEDDYRRVLNAFLIDLTYASSTLENVKISWLDTKSLIEFGEQPKGLTKAELAIVLNHKDSIRFLSENDLQISKRDICDVHKLLMTGLLGNPEDAGRLRRGTVFFDGCKYMPLNNGFILEEQFLTFCKKAQSIINPLERSFFTMLMIPYLQPFQDGNKRTSRLCMNLPLIEAGLSPFSFTSVKKSEYMFALLAFYERGKTHFMSKVFKDAYAISAPKYGEIMRFLSDGGTLSTLGDSPRQRY